MSDNLLQRFVADYLERSRRFRFGQDDCTVGLASEWVRERTGIDFGAAVRGTYRTRDEGLEVLRQRGGWVSLLDGLFTPAGIERTDDPMTGDIGIVSQMGEDTLAIRLRNLWGVRALYGFGAVEANHIAAWRIP